MSIPKQHPLCQHTHCFGITSKLQEMVCLLAQDYVFAQAEEVLTEVLGLSLSAKQIQRLSEHYGEKLEAQSEAVVQDKEPAPVLCLRHKAEVVYTMLDGSMLLFRNKGWGEVKIGRLFRACSRVKGQKKRTQVLESLYVCHVGGHRKFLQKLETYTEPYRRKVFLCDGAKWIWNWVEDAYPEAVQILDFYHAVEKLGVYAGLQFSDEQQRKAWLENKKECLLNGGVANIIAELKATKPLNQQARNARQQVVSYYETNQRRMQYHLYRQQGLLIGSGAVEAAHRHVVQHRLKLSGQHWSKNGAQQILNLRATRKSKQWNKVVELIKSAA